jgi:nitroreductase
MTNHVIESLKSHRSIRQFKPRPLEPQTLDLILQAGVRAATSMNLQAYSFIVVDDPDKKRAFGDEPMFETATAIVAVVDLYRLKRWLALNDTLFYLDHAASLFTGLWDGLIALQNVVVAAESLGLGTVYIGSVLGRDLSQILGTPKYVVPAGLVLVGYPDEAPELRSRLPLEAVVHRNRYQIPSDDEIRAFYRDKDREWDDLPEDERRELEAQGITNMAQELTGGFYSAEHVARESAVLLDNLRRAGFKLD